jgi:hypothetical protein
LSRKELQVHAPAWSYGSVSMIGNRCVKDHMNIWRSNRLWKLSPSVVFGILGRERIGPEKRVRVVYSVYAQNRVDDCNGDCSTTTSHRSGRYSCPARKLPVLGGHFHLFPLLDEERNPDFHAGLQSSSLGPAARRVASNRRFRVSNVQLNEYRQL